MTHPRAWLAVVLTASLAVGPGCSDSGPRTIERTRIAAKPDPPVIPGVTAAQRFMWRPNEEEAQRAQVDAAPPPKPPAFQYALPSGWEVVPPTQFRHINTRVAGVPNAECYLTFLPGDGGGDLPNVNRWRGEMGLPPVDAAAVAALPRTTLLGQPALLTDLTGSFTSMSGAKIDEARMLGVLLTQQGMPGALFVKFVGPTAVVSQNVDAFEAFVASIDFGEEPAPPPTSSALTWTVPAGWTAEPGARAMREVTLTKGGSELYVSVLGGGGGGLLANVNRWLKQFGAPALDVAGVSALERTPCLGGEAYVVTAEGSFAGMDGVARDGQGLLGALLEQPSRLVTVKLVGPAAEVRAERDAFLAFVGSLAARP